MKDAIKYVLNNENGSPSIELLIGVMVCFGLTIFIVKIKKVSHEIARAAIDTGGRL